MVSSRERQSGASNEQKRKTHTKASGANAALAEASFTGTRRKPDLRRDCNNRQPAQQVPDRA